MTAQQTIDWSKVKMTNAGHFNSRYVETPSGRGESFVNKGRKMVIVWNFIRSEDVTFKRKGYRERCTKSYFNVDIYMDFGAVHSCIADKTVMTEHYVLPNGTTVGNKWRIYEHFKNNLS